MAMNEKVTYVMALNSVLDSFGEQMTAEVREKLTALRDAQVKRSSAERKPTKAQTEAVANAEIVMEALANIGKAVTVSELMEADATLSTMSNQKVASVVRKLVTDGKVIRTEEKHKAYFALA